MTISILGCGWLGFPLAKTLIEVGFTVKGSTTSESKIPVLESAGIIPLLISISEEKIDGDMVEFLDNVDLLIIDIPPKSRHSENPDFSKKIQILIPYIEKSAIKKVIFVSSTSVYADDNSMISEADLPNADSSNGKQLAIAEMLFQNNTSFESTIIRFGGLIGADRHPVKFLAGRQNIDNPDAPINLIHQKDCIGIILEIIRQQKWNEIFNAVTPYHPTRQDYYTQKATKLNLPLPEFTTQNPSIGKTISSDKVRSFLGYEFLEPNL